MNNPTKTGKTYRALQTRTRSALVGLIRSITLGACAALLCAASAASPAPKPVRAGAAAAVAAAAATETGTRSRIFKLGALGLPGPLNFRGIDHSIFLPLSVRLDESVVSAHLHLRYTFSPSLLPQGCSLLPETLPPVLTTRSLG